MERQIFHHFQKLEPSFTVGMVKSTMAMLKAAKVHNKSIIFFRAGMVLMLGVHIVWDLILEFEGLAEAFSSQFLSAPSLLFQVGDLLNTQTHISHPIPVADEPISRGGLLTVGCTFAPLYRRPPL